MDGHWQIHNLLGRGDKSSLVLVTHYVTFVFLQVSPAAAAAAAVMHGTKITCNHEVWWCCDADLRLVSNNPREGRLEIFHNGSWGTVCNDAFDDIDAQVACYSLGFGLLCH